MHLVLTTKRGETSSWCRSPVRYEEMEDMENLWLGHKPGFLAKKYLKRILGHSYLSSSLKSTAEVLCTTGKYNYLGKLRIPPGVANVNFQHALFRNRVWSCETKWISFRMSQPTETNSHNSSVSTSITLRSDDNRNLVRT